MQITQGTSENTTKKIVDFSWDAFHSSTASASFYKSIIREVLLQRIMHLENPWAWQIWVELYSSVWQTMAHWSTLNCWTRWWHQSWNLVVWHTVTTLGMPMENFALLSHFALLALASLQQCQLNVFLTFLYQSLFLVHFPTSPLQAHVFLLLISAKLRVLFTELFQILHFWANDSRLSSLVIIGLRVVVKLVVEDWWLNGGGATFPGSVLAGAGSQHWVMGSNPTETTGGFLLVGSGIRANSHSTTMRPQPFQRAPHMIVSINGISPWE